MPCVRSWFRCQSSQRARLLCFARGTRGKYKMADEETKNLLRTCANNLLSAVNQLESRSSPTTTPTTCNNQNQQQQQQQSQQYNSANSVAAEQRRLFSGYKPPSSRTMTTSTPKRRIITNNKGERLSIPIRNTWTRTFVCLAQKGVITVPTTEEKMALALNGIEERSISFQKGGTGDHVHSVILDAFPQLQEGGGYEIMRTGDRGNRNLIVLEIPRGGYSVNYLKSTLGSAKAYLRPLQKNIPLFAGKSNASNSKDQSPAPKVECMNCHSLMEMGEIQDHQAICAGGSSTCTQPQSQENEKLQELREIFPNASENTLETALFLSCDDVQKAVMKMLEGDSSNATSSSASKAGFFDDDDADDDLLKSAFDIEPVESAKDIKDVLRGLQNKLTGQQIRVHTSEDDILEDAIAIYKDPNFKAHRPIRVTFRGQPAVDTGGPRKEFYSMVYIKLADGLLQLFEGPPTRVIPRYSSRNVFSGVMKCIGTMMAHSIVQCGVGLSRLSPVSYWYLVHDDVNKAISYAEITDIHDVDFAECLGQILDVKTDDDAKALNNNSGFINVLSEIGSTSTLTLQNKDEIMQCIMLHYLINKRKVVLDQLKEGLKSLGFLDTMRQYPEILASMFITQAELVTSAKVKQLLSFDSPDATEVKTMLLSFIDESDAEVLTKLLRHVTGTSNISTCGSLRVEFDSHDGTIFASTCLSVLHLPPQVSSFEEFKDAMKAVLANSWPSFNAM